jgi:hypothetical protein
MDKITCIQGSGHGKVCVACIKAKQHCRSFLGEEKWPVVESAGLGGVGGGGGDGDPAECRQGFEGD